MYFNNLYDAVKAIAPEALDALSEEEALGLKHYLDFEAIELCVVDDEVAVFDTISGDCVGSLSAEEFVEQALDLV